MKTCLYITLPLLLLVPLAAVSQSEARVRDLRMVQTPEEITLECTLDVGPAVAAPGARVTLTPRLVNGDRSIELTGVVVRGRRAAILEHRDVIASGRRTFAPGFIAAHTGETVNYRAAVPFEDWMPGATLMLQVETETCGHVTRTVAGTLAEGVIVPLADFTATERVVVPGRVLSTADKLVPRFPFVHPAAGYVDAPPSSRMSRMEGGLTIMFRRGRDKIEPDYRDNYRSLVDLLSVIEEIRSSSDSRIDRIAITGFASPEGTHEGNVKLSEGRAEAMRRVIVQNSPALADVIKVYAGGEDWDGLRELVAGSSMENRDEALRLIDRKDKAALMRLDGGETYRRMERELFPELREATFILVYYKNTVISD